MADRGDLNFSPSVTDVTPENPDLGTATNTIMQVGDQIAQQSAQAKALQATAQTSTAFRQLDSQFRLNHADDPTNPEALQQLQAARKEVVQTVGANVPSIAMRAYTNKTIELGQQSDVSNTLWSTKQQVRNASNNLQTSRELFLTQANQAGQDYAKTGDGDVGAVLDYVQAGNSMKQFADPVIGGDKTNAFLKDFNTDYVKSFVAGVAENNPKQAAELLDDPNIQQHFTTQDRGDMAQLIQRTQRQQQLTQNLQTVKTNADLTGIVNDPNSTYYEKRVQIDKMDMAGAVTPKAASAARRVLTSQSDLDAQTDTPAMSDIINKTYDLNANANVNPDDYLMGVHDIQQQVLDMQGANKITAPDAQKLSNRITNLTSSRMASATQSVGNEFYEANQKFDALPPEYRGQATRALFYVSHGQNFSQQQFANQAQQIIDQINTRRRQSALDTVTAAQQSDTDFLKTIPNASPEAIDATAKKYGISQQEVITQLRANAAAHARDKASARVPRQAPSDIEDVPDDGGGRISKPAPITVPEDTTGGEDQ